MLPPQALLAVTALTERPRDLTRELGFRVESGPLGMQLRPLSSEVWAYLAYGGLLLFASWMLRELLVERRGARALLPRAVAGFWMGALALGTFGPGWILWRVRALLNLQRYVGPPPPYIEGGYSIPNVSTFLLWSLAGCLLVRYRARVKFHALRAARPVALKARELWETVAGRYPTG